MVFSVSSCYSQYLSISLLLFNSPLEKLHAVLVWFGVSRRMRGQQDQSVLSSRRSHSKFSAGLGALSRQVGQ